jgi:4-hydroxybenzoate polyprenyltransferase
VAVGSAWAYNAGVKATVLSPLPYAVSFGLLPAFVTLGLPGHPWPRPALMGATALLGIGAHFINTLADREDDARSGIAGLPQRMGATACLLTGVLLLSACAVAIWTLGGGSAVARTVLLALCLGAAAMVVTTTLRSAPRAAWTWTLVTVLGCLVLFSVARPSLVHG